MLQYFLNLSNFFLFICILSTFGESNGHQLICTICSEPLQNEFLIDAWGNPFHPKHQKEGIFCNSCSRIISQKVTKGGYRYNDERHICSLCQITVVQNESEMKSSYLSVLSQLDSIGINTLPNKINIELINLIELNNKTGYQNHGNIKGYTFIDKSNIHKLTYTVFILFGLPKVEFEAVLAHELLHVWIEFNGVNLKPLIKEGFCNLGSFLIYYNDNTKFSKIHLDAMDNDIHPIYGDGYRKMKNNLDLIGWTSLLEKLESIK